MTTTKMHQQEQHGDYVLELPHPRALWGVRMAGATQYLTRENTKSDCLAAIKRFQASDARRAKAGVIK